jgi:hypothetical protein
MRKLVATITAAFTLAALGLAAHSAASDAPADACFGCLILPYIEQDNIYRSW